MPKRPASGSTCQAKCSSVWSYYDTLEDVTIVKCMVEACTKRVVRRGKPGTQKKDLGTKSMWDHLKIYHTVEYKEACKVRDEHTVAKKAMAAKVEEKKTIFLLKDPTATRQMTLLETKDRAQPWPAEHTEQRELEYMMGEWLCNAVLPYTVASDDCLLAFLNRLNKKFTPPSEKKLRQNIIPDIYARVKREVQTILKDAVEIFSATTDIWSSKSQNSFLSFTLHFVNSEWKRKSCVLQCLPFDDSHTGETIATSLASIVTSWGLNGMIHVMVRDNAQNMVKAMAINGWTDAGCFLHTLNLVVNHSIFVQSGVKAMMSRAKKLVTYIRCSPKASAILKKHQNELGIEDNTLILGEPTRWGSYYDMLCRLIQQKRAIRRLEVDDSLTLSEQQTLTPNDWLLIPKVL